MKNILINDTCIFILTYGRANNQKTLKMLKDFGVEIPIYLVCSDDDNQLQDYIKLYKDMVQVFNKKEVAEKTNTIKIIDTEKSVLYTRNYVFELARKLKYDYFIMLDDDYRYIYSLYYRFIGNKGKLSSKGMLHNMLCACVDFMRNTKNVDCMGLAQGGDMQSGLKCNLQKNYRRKIMNVYFCATAREFKFIGTMNDDVNTYTLLGLQGKLFFQIPFLVVQQIPTQTQKGGLTEMYLEHGTFKKSFCTKILAPAICKVAFLKDLGRIHHRINYKGMPRVISDKYYKNKKAI